MRTAVFWSHEIDGSEQRLRVAALGLLVMVILLSLAAIQSGSHKCQDCQEQKA